MKKTLLAAIAGLLCLALAACGGAAASSTASAATPTAAPEATAAPTEEPAPSEPAQPEEAAPDSELSALVDAIYAFYTPEIPLGTRAVDLSDPAWLAAYTGLTDASGLDAAVVSESMIGSQAYSLVLARAKDGAALPDIAAAMAAGIDPRKWVCVEADQISYAYGDSYVLLVMADSGLDIDTNKITEAFLEAGNPDGHDGWGSEAYLQPAA